DAINDSTIYVNVGVELSLTTIFFLYSPVVDSLVCLGVLVGRNMRKMSLFDCVFQKQCIIMSSYLGNIRP
ncbi:MAG: hypothetical protein J6H31_05175, partial [Butyrivibrio sp.]|nr:hypothetical protein [Butyrivibrio sp.]